MRKDDGRGHRLKHRRSGGRRRVHGGGVFLVDGQALIGLDVFEDLPFAVGPDHPQRVYRGVPSEAEVQCRRDAGEVTAHRHLLDKLLLPPRVERHLRADAGGVFSLAPQVYPQIMPPSPIHRTILEDGRRLVDVIGDQIEVAVVIEVRVSRAGTPQRTTQAPVCRHVLKAQPAVVPKRVIGEV